MLMSPNEGETAVHGCYWPYRGNRGVGTCAPLLSIGIFLQNKGEFQNFGLLQVKFSMHWGRRIILSEWNPLYQWNCQEPRSGQIYFFPLNTPKFVENIAWFGFVRQNICYSGTFLLAGRFEKNSMSLEGKSCWEIDNSGCLRGFG